MDSTSALGAGRALLLDGGTGSELRRRGVALSPACWSAGASITHRQLLQQIHRDYIDAGADIVTASTFATTRFVLAGAGLGHQFEAINAAAVDAAFDAVAKSGADTAVAASLSCLPPRFDVSAYPPPDAAYRAYAELAEFVAGRGVGLILVEMLQDPQHAALACRAAASTGLPFGAGLSCRLGPGAGARNGPLVAFDNPAIRIDAVLAAVMPFEPALVSIMHTPLATMQPALEWLCGHFSGPIGAYAEIPYAENPDAAPIDAPVDAAAYGQAARQWLAAGASLVGGCCGTGPEHIRTLRAVLDG